MRFTIRRMLVAFALFSFVLAGLVSPNRWWASVAVTAISVWLFAALALAVGATARKRAVWLAVLLVGLSYSFACGRLTYYPVATQSSSLITSRLLGVSFKMLHRQPSPVPVPYNAPVYAAPPLASNQPWQVPPAQVAVMPTPVVGVALLSKQVHYLAVGEALFTFLFSLAGGWLAGWAYAKRGSGSPTPPDAQQTTLG